MSMHVYMCMYMYMYICLYGMYLHTHIHMHVPMCMSKHLMYIGSLYAIYLGAWCTCVSSEAQFVSVQLTVASDVGAGASGSHAWGTSGRSDLPQRSKEFLVGL